MGFCESAVGEADGFGMDVVWAQGVEILGLDGDAGIARFW